MTKEPFNIATLDTFTRAYMECALWSTPDSEGGNLDYDKDITDIAPETREKMIAACAKFQSENRALLDAEYKAWEETREIRKRLDDSFAGHDFWLTRCGHGAGFWDGDWPVNGDALTEACKAYGNVALYIGDDGLIYA